MASAKPIPPAISLQNEPVDLAAKQVDLAAKQVEVSANAEPSEYADDPVTLVGLLAAHRDYDFRQYEFTRYQKRQLAEYLWQAQEVLSELEEVLKAIEAEDDCD
jgi:hypothetical protein